jgi:hypothetical protein
MLTARRPLEPRNFPSKHVLELQRPGVSPIDRRLLHNLKDGPQSVDEENGSTVHHGVRPGAPAALCFLFCDDGKGQPQAPSAGQEKPTTCFAFSQFLDPTDVIFITEVDTARASPRRPTRPPLKDHRYPTR